MLYFKYKKFIKIFKFVKRFKKLDNIEFKLEEKYGHDAEEALSILRAKGAFVCIGILHEGIDSAKIDAIILEYEERCSSMFWGFVKWAFATLLSIGGLVVTYLSFVKN